MILAIEALRVRDLAMGEKFCHYQGTSSTWPCRWYRPDRLAHTKEFCSQEAMDALLSGLDLEDGSIRYKVVLALEEMVHHFPDLQLDGQAIEKAIISEARRYYRRFVTLYTLFGDGRELPIKGAWLLRQSLIDNMEREKERAIKLLSLIYSSEDIRRASTALQAGDPAKRAHAIERSGKLDLNSVRQKGL